MLVNVHCVGQGLAGSKQTWNLYLMCAIPPPGDQVGPTLGWLFGGRLVVGVRGSPDPGTLASPTPSGARSPVSVRTVTVLCYTARKRGVCTTRSFLYYVPDLIVLDRFALIGLHVKT